jgi:hypothetical protein
MSRSALLFIIAALAIGVAILGYFYYQERNAGGLEIKIDKGGIKIDGS